MVTSPEVRATLLALIPYKPVLHEVFYVVFPALHFSYADGKERLKKLIVFFLR